jgi:hypothetical protein
LFDYNCPRSHNKFSFSTAISTTTTTTTTITTTTKKVLYPTNHPHPSVGILFILSFTYSLLLEEENLFFVLASTRTTTTRAKLKQ